MSLVVGPVLAPASRAKNGTSQATALLVVEEVSLGSAEILTQATPADPSADTKLAAKLVEADGKSKVVHLSLCATDGSWQFVVPPDSVDRSAAQLQKPTVAN